jgi:2,5-diketo-D-gluconate reductase A
MIPTITLNDGTVIPQLGFGTYGVQPDREVTPANVARTAEVVGLALGAGYRLIDTAQSYGTERGVGAAIATSGIPRGELYVTSKLGNGNHQPDDVRHTFHESLDRLGLDYLDLFLIHWPVPTLYGGDYVSTWKAMVGLVADRRLRTAGVSNFQPAHLDRVVAETGVAPAVNQVEVHPYFANTAACAASIRHGTAVEAWSPLAGGGIIEDPTIARIAVAHGRSSAQVVLRWHVQHGNVVIPRATDPEQIAANFDLFGFELTVEEIASIDALDKGEGGRRGPHPDPFVLIL